MKLIKYSAVWCGPCKNFAPIAKQVTNELNMPMEEVDIDDTPTPGITGVPTIRLVDDNNNTIAEHTGALNAPKLREWIQTNTK